MADLVSLQESSLRQALHKLLLSFPAAWLRDERAARLEAYAEALQHFPIKYVRQSCGYAAAGRIGRFLPSVGELVQLTEQLRAKEEKKDVEATIPKMIAMPWPERIPVVFDPKAKTFSPYQLGMTKEQIIAKLQEE